MLSCMFIYLPAFELGTVLNIQDIRNHRPPGLNVSLLAAGVFLGILRDVTLVLAFTGSFILYVPGSCRSVGVVG